MKRNLWPASLYGGGGGLVGLVPDPLWNLHNKVMNVNNCYTEGHIKTNNKLSVERGKSNLGIVVVVVELTVVKVSGYTWGLLILLVS
jgi:hypothetical protein